MQIVKCIWCHALCTLPIANWLHPHTPISHTPICSNASRAWICEGELSGSRWLCCSGEETNDTPGSQMILSYCLVSALLPPDPAPPTPTSIFICSFINLTLCSSADESLPRSSASDPVTLASNYGKLTLDTHQMSCFSHCRVFAGESKDTAGSTLRPPPMLSWSTVPS